MEIGVVLVTYNRLGDLKNTLKAYENQIYKPRFIMVVDNNSNDGTGAYLQGWAAEKSDIQHQHVALPQNIGGSGGFHEGMERALNEKCDWIFVADDDATPHLDMFQNLVTFMENRRELVKETAAVCTAVNNRGHYAGIHRCRAQKGILGVQEAYIPEEEYKNEYFEVDFYSFVGTMIRKEALQKAGTARGDFFIYNDDYEHAVRVKKCGKIICIPAAVMDHVDNYNYERQATWRDYYATRNAVIMHRTHFGRYAGFMRALRRLGVAVTTFNGKKIKVIWAGVQDAYKNKTGIHPTYKPGWKA